jgi:hypothetical protein
MPAVRKLQRRPRPEQLGQFVVSGEEVRGPHVERRGELLREVLYRARTRQVVSARAALL